MDQTRNHFQRNTSWNAPYTFSGKEKDAETGYGYVKKLRFFSSLAFGNEKQVFHYAHCLRRFGARYYDSGLSIWLSVDPMAEKYPHQTNYVYCSNNPVIIVDPNGEDEWQVNLEGFVSKVPNTENVPDVLFVIDENGNKTTDENGEVLSLSVSRNTMEQLSSVDANSNSKALGISKQDEYNTLFNFVADNTHVEWMTVGYDAGNGNFVDAIVTSHKNSKTTTFMERGVTYFKHSHPNVVKTLEHNQLHDPFSNFYGGNLSPEDRNHKNRVQMNNPGVTIPFTLRFEGKDKSY